VLHTGDFKIEMDPMDGEAFDSEGFRALGDRGVLLMLSDSTGASAPGRTRGERVVLEALEERISAWPGRVIVAQFSSNLHRLRGLQTIAGRTGRKLCLLGRSLHTYSALAEKAGIASIDRSRVVNGDHLESIPPHEALVVMTGTQAERRAALFRAALDEHGQIRIGSDDLILMSARYIPGNEGEIYEMIGELARRGATVVSPRDGIHASGHARRDELRELIELVRPRHFVPVHGEYAFLVDHRQMAIDAGVPDTLLITNGEEFAVDDDAGLRRVAEHGLEAHYHDGSVVADAGALRFDDRRKLFHNGILCAHVHVRPPTRARKLDAEVELQSRGVYTHSGLLLGRAATRVENELGAVSADATDEAIEDEVEQQLRRFFRKEVGKKPTVVTFVTRTPRGTDA